MAAKKVGGLRMAWPGDQFHVGSLRFDQEGSWDKDDKPVTFNEAEAEEMVALGVANNVTLVPVESSEPGTGPTDTAPTP